MKHLAILLVLIVVTLNGSGCTRMPVDYHEHDRRLPVVGDLDRKKLELVATTAVGTSAVFRDYLTGISSEITVESEYFSANGRLCRKFTERQSVSKSSRNGLGCRTDSGWIDIPVDSFAG